MATESLTYAQIAERLGINAEAARGLVRRHHLPRSTANDGKTVILVDLTEIAHRKSARKPGGVQEDPGRMRLEELLARIAALEAELRLPMSVRVDSGQTTNGSGTEVIGSGTEVIG